MKKKKKLLFIHHGGGVGGAVLSLQALVRSIDRNKYEIKVLLILCNKEAINLFNEDDISVECIQSPFYKKGPKYFIHSDVGTIKIYNFYKYIPVVKYWVLSATKYAQEILNIEKPDILHLNSSVLTDWCFAAKKVGVKNIIHIREPISSGILGFRKKIFQKLVEKYSDHIIAISKDNAARVNLPNKTTVIYNQLKIPNKDFSYEYNNNTVFYAGGVDLHKGFLLLAKALPYIDKSIKIIIAGNIYFEDRKPTQPSYYKNKKVIKLFQEIKKDKRVELVGVTSNVFELLDRSTLSLSVFSKPHFSRLILESYSLKKPVIGSDVKGMEEVIDHEKSGYIIPKNNPVLLADAINDLCLNPKKAREMGEYGYSLYQEKFHTDYDNQFENIYNSLLK